MLCGVTATLGSNPSATATAARPHWGRAVLLCRRGVRGLLVTPLVGRAALCARGRRPARSALFVAPLVFRAPEGPAVGPGCLVCPWAAARPRAVRAASFARRVASKPGQALPPPINFARNSPEACSNIEFTSLELQRFWGVSKNDRRKLCATFGQCGLCCRLRVLGSDSPAIHALVIPEAVGVLHYTKPAGGVSPACRTLV